MLLRTGSRPLGVRGLRLRGLRQRDGEWKRALIVVSGGLGASGGALSERQTYTSSFFASHSWSPMEPNGLGRSRDGISGDRPLRLSTEPLAMILRVGQGSSVGSGVAPSQTSSWRRDLGIISRRRLACARQEAKTSSGFVR